LQKNKDTI